MALEFIDDPLIQQKLNYHLRLRRLVTYMKEHPAEPLTLAAAARIVCMERTAFSRFFSRTVGITFHEFVQHWKIATVVDQMKASDRSLSELAYAVGFENINSFGRTFKKVTHMTPSEYRRKLLADYNTLLPGNGDGKQMIEDI